jgi:hypothetical protein
MTFDRQSNNTPIRARSGRYADTLGTVALIGAPSCSYIIESTSFRFSVFCPSPSPVLTAIIRQDKTRSLNGTAMRVRYSFQVAQMMSVQLLRSFNRSGVNLDKCLVQDLSLKISPDAVDEKYKSEQRSCGAIL